MQLPKYPTTTIGSFPQTKEIRKCRADFKASRITEADHDKQMDQFIKEVIGVQEEIGLDVFVHGEPERSDMYASCFAYPWNNFLFLDPS